MARTIEELQKLIDAGEHYCMQDPVSWHIYRTMLLLELLTVQCGEVMDAIATVSNQAKVK